MSQSLRFVFIVQGEGRGHMTQALALSKILIEAGHELGHVFVGKSGRREIPSYFLEKIPCEVSLLQSPNFITDSSNKSIRLGPTISQNLLKTTTYLSGLKKINKVVKEYEPHILINFYDLLGGLYNWLYRPKCKMVCIAHQYLAVHPDFKFAKGTFLDRAAYKALNFLTSLGHEAIWSLSFRPYSPQAGMTIIPPLLRSELKELTSTDGDYIHGYLLNDGYAEEITNWHSSNPAQALYFFWDKKGEIKERIIDEKLAFHPINDHKFLQKMAGCKAYVSTAGFESICEAMYLGKPIMLVPVEGHFEQACNAIDAVDSGAGVASDHFDLSILVDYLPSHQDRSAEFRTWADQSAHIIHKEIARLGINPKS